LREWDLKLPHVEFSYNRALVKSTACLPSEALYGINPLAKINVIPLLADCKVSYEAE